MTFNPQQVENNLSSTTKDHQHRAFNVLRFNILLYNDLSSNDVVERSVTLNKIIKLVKDLAKECYLPVRGSTAGTVGRGSPSNTSSPTSNMSGTPTSSHRSSISGDYPYYTDGSASLSSYAASPVVDNGIQSIDYVTNANDEKNVDVNEDQENTTEPQRICVPDGIPIENHPTENNISSPSDAFLRRHGISSEEERKESVGLLILTMLRMSIDCPFADVRLSFGKCLTDLKTMGVPVPVPINPSPSLFIMPENILTLEWPSEKSNNKTSEDLSTLSSSEISPKQPHDLVKTLMNETFSTLGRLSHYYRVLAYFPSFMEKYQISYNTIVRGSGPVPANWRYYIGIMAASQHKCQYVVSKLTSDFLINGGKSDWLQGLQHVPEKIRNLATLNTILAHQPWRLQASHIGALVPEFWSIAEIIHVITILSTFHSLSSFVLGCGIVPEYDSIGGYIEQPAWIPTTVEKCSIGILDFSDRNIGTGLGITNMQPDDNDDDTGKPATEKVIAEEIEIEKHTNQLIKRLMDKPELPELHLPNSENNESNEISNFENIEEETFTIESPTTEITPSPSLLHQRHSSIPNITSRHPIYSLPSTNLTSEYFSRFIEPSVEIVYADFVKSTECSVFRLQDFGWDHCVSTVNTLFSGVGDLLDAEFSRSLEITDFSLGLFTEKSSNIDARPFRQAIWFYVLRLSGLFKDDYEYKDINTFLNNKIKAFIKKVCCKPEEIEYSDWRNIGFKLRDEEKCHVNLIVAEARKQAELIYGLSCVAKFREE